jgi:hypothetical protein
MHCTTVLAIANRLSADQALGDMVERVARVWRVRWTCGVVRLSIPQVALWCGISDIADQLIAGRPYTSNQTFLAKLAGTLSTADMQQAAAYLAAN